MGQMSHPPALDARVVARLHEECGADRWHVTTDDLGHALLRSLTKSFGERVPDGQAFEQYARGLHLADLALACGCAAGNDEAWQHFITTYRPVLHRTADALEPGGGARDLADGLYAELFGVTDGRIARPSLFRYYHGRSSLATWLRAVLSQRHVDRVRARRRTEPLPEADSPGEMAAAPAPAPERGRIVTLMRAALAFALGLLAPPDRFRLSCYYARQMTLAQIGRLLGEHEATVSRHVARSRRDIRASVESFLAREGLVAAEVDDCFRSIAADPGDLDLATLFATGESEVGARKNPAESRSKEGAV